MHECHECGQACDCDGEDTWFDNYPGCICDCEDKWAWDDLTDLDDIDDYGPIYEEDELYDSLPWWKKITYRVRNFIWSVREIFARPGDYFQFCIDCGKLKYFLGRHVGKHDDCIPF